MTFEFEFEFELRFIASEGREGNGLPAMPRLLPMIITWRHAPRSAGLATI